MSTRSTTHFTNGHEVIAIIYRHSDGYPDGAGADLLRFIEETGKLSDSRHADPSYLSAKYVVFLAREFARGSNPLDFCSVGVVSEDPGDIEYRYVVDCDKSPLSPQCFEVDVDNNKAKLVKWPAAKRAS